MTIISATACCRAVVEPRMTIWLARSQCLNVIPSAISTRCAVAESLTPPEYDRHAGFSPGHTQA